MRPYSDDLREPAVQGAEAGKMIRSIAAALRISPSCVFKWRKRRRETGALTPRPDGRPQAAHPERRVRGLAARADGGRTFYHPRPDGGTCRARHEDRSARCVVFPACRGDELQKNLIVGRAVPPRHRVQARTLEGPSRQG